jgi:hypothetical protein
MYSFWGNLYNGGILNKIGTKITSNSQLELKIDYVQSIFYLKFLDLEIEETQIIPLPAEMRNQPLHLVVKSSFRGD